MLIINITNIIHFKGEVTTNISPGPWKLGIHLYNSIDVFIWRYDPENNVFVIVIHNNQNLTTKIGIERMSTEQ